MADKDTGMAEPPVENATDPDPDADATYVESDRDSTAFTPHRRPRWVKVSLIVVGALIALFLILQVTGVGPGGGHGPGRHSGAQGPGAAALFVGQAAPAGLG